MKSDNSGHFLGRLTRGGSQQFHFTAASCFKREKKREIPPTVAEILQEDLSFILCHFLCDSYEPIDDLK